MKQPLIFVTYRFLNISYSFFLPRQSKAFNLVLEKGQKLFSDYGVKNESNSKWHEECINRLFFARFPGKKWSEKLVKERWHNAPCIKRELLFYSGYNTVVRRSILSFLVLACALYVCTYAECRHISGRHMYVALLHMD